MPDGIGTTRLILPVTPLGRPDPPRWAERSVSEEGEITHERVSVLRPTIQAWPGRQAPTEVSVSVVDRCVDGAWVRGAPTVQVEGGSYGVPQIRELRRALDDILALADGDPPA